MCNSITWVNQHIRNPTPHVIRWEPHQPKRVSPTGVNLGLLHFWLDISGDDKYDSDMVEVSVDVEHNAVKVHRTGSWLKLLLDARIVKIDQPLTVEIASQSLNGRSIPAATLTVKLDTSDVFRARVMERTLYERGDPEFIFETECKLYFTGEKWEAKTT